MAEIIHLSGFMNEDRPREVRVSIHRDANLLTIAKGVLEGIRQSPRSEVFDVRTTRTLGGDLVEVEAMSRTTLDSGYVGTMWHLFTTESEPWPLAAHPGGETNGK